jgi:hypothetical protein
VNVHVQAARDKQPTLCPYIEAIHTYNRIKEHTFNVKLGSIFYHGIYVYALLFLFVVFWIY